MKAVSFCTPRAAALGGVLREYLMAARYSLLAWAADRIRAAGQEVLSELEFTGGGQEEFCRNPHG